MRQHRLVVERDQEIDLLRQQLAERDWKILELEARLRDIQTLQERLLEAGGAVNQKEMLLRQSSRTLEERLAAQQRTRAELTQRLAGLDQARKAIGELIAERDALLRRIDEFERTPAARLQAFLRKGPTGKK
jgi:chromosome segregation ATPase